MQIDDFYAFGIIVLGVVLTLFGLILLLVHIPGNKELDNYRQARRAMAVAYLFFAAVNFAELALQDAGGSIDIMVIKMVTISVAFSQALLFTYACLRLLYARREPLKRINMLLIPVVALVGAVFTVFFIFDATVFAISVYVFMAAYIATLVYYTWRFTTTHRSFCRRMDNYFSTNEAARLRWVAIGFYTALGVGIMALVATWFTSTLFALCFDMFAIWFYTHFGIRLINYLWQFEHLHPAIDTPDIKEYNAQTTDIETALSPENKRLIELEREIEKWMAEKRYTDQSITIDVLAKELRTNRNYLSYYLNTLKNKTFRSWINELRIEEAKRLMADSQKSIADIAMEVGFADRSNFFRQFSQLTGTTPKAWLAKQGL